MRAAVTGGTQENAGHGHITGFGSFGDRTCVLPALTMVYTLSFVDRIVISVGGGPPVIEEFQLTNFQFGILSGIGFALFYTLLDIPIARFSERPVQCFRRRRQRARPPAPRGESHRHPPDLRDRGIDLQPRRHLLPDSRPDFRQRPLVERSCNLIQQYGNNTDD